ncbi:MAG: hypothetical protein P8Y70_14515 [Candidatus Lokiarchaeota archaeon]
MLSDIKNLGIQCPICLNYFHFEINEEIIINSKTFPVPFIINHCNRTILVYIDANFQVRGSHLVFNSYDVKRMNKEDSPNSGRLLRVDEIEELSLDQRTLYKCLTEFHSVQNEIIPDIFEKQILLILSNKKELSLESLLKELPKLEKALNKRMGREGLLKILDKFIEKNLVKEHILGENIK